MMDTSGNHNKSQSLRGEAVAGAISDVNAGESGAECGFSITSPDESWKLAIKSHKQSLVHSCQCRDINCRFPFSDKMKRYFLCMKACKLRSTKVGGTGSQKTPVCPFTSTTALMIYSIISVKYLLIVSIFLAVDLACDGPTGRDSAPEQKQSTVLVRLAGLQSNGHLTQEQEPKAGK